MRHRTPMAIALTAVVALAPLAAFPAFAASTAGPASPTAATTGDPAAGGPKVVIVVGATEGHTAGYRSDADKIAAEALKHTSNVVKLYSPNAKWAQVKAAAQGASIFVYLGHGYGYPSPYRAVLSPDVQDGMGLNTPTGTTDSDKKYYGEDFIASDIRFAKDAIVLLNHLCYSAGSSESGDPEPTVAVARERVDNFASGFIKAGARSVIAQSWTSGVIYMINRIFTSDQTILDAWEAAPNKQGHVQPFIPARNPAFEARVDPDTWTTGYHRSIVAATNHSTTQIREGAGVAQTTGAPGPEVWSVDGRKNLKPNADGKADRLNLLARFSESVDWTARVKDADGDTVRTQSGSGHQALVTWDARVDGAAAPDGDYTWHLTAADAAGGTVEKDGNLTVETLATPSTGVLSFRPTTPTMTKVGTINYSLVFAGPVTGLSRSDFTRTGNAAGCKLSAPVAAGPMDGSVYTLGFTACGTGTVGLFLNQGQVVGPDSAAGPNGPIAAAKVTIDTSKPKVPKPNPKLRTGVALEGASTTQRLLMTLTWGGTDTGSGIASYDVQRSYDGGAFQTIASATTAKSLNWTMTPGHNYRFRVRARDNAGNVGAWSPYYTWYPVLTQQSSGSLKWAGTWTTASNAQSSGGSATSASAAGASVSYTFNGRAVAWVTTLRPDAGEVEVWIDGTRIATVDTQADETTYRQVVYAKGWTSYGTHTIKLVVAGTADRPLATLDAFELIK